MKKCPFCAEEIQDDAILCRYCGSRLEETLPAQESKKCPHCAEQIRVDAKLCRFCGSTLDEYQSKTEENGEHPIPENMDAVENNKIVSDSVSDPVDAKACEKTSSVFYLAQVIALLPTGIYVALKHTSIKACWGDMFHLECREVLLNLLDNFSLLKGYSIQEALAKSDLTQRIDFLYAAYAWLSWTIIIAVVLLLLRVLMRKKICFFYGSYDRLISGVKEIDVGVRISLFLVAFYFFIRYAPLLSLINTILPS